ncbi:hypothetical protein K438DRAFT_1867714, partial [Mycena galopus ATCC 62051]
MVGANHIWLLQACFAPNTLTRGTMLVNATEAQCFPCLQPLHGLVLKVPSVDPFLSPVFCSWSLGGFARTSSSQN